MVTQSVDLAAYLLLNGLEPKDVTLQPSGDHRGGRGYWTYRYESSPALELLMAAYNDNAQVPVKAFVLARAQVKNHSQLRRARRDQQLSRYETED